MKPKKRGGREAEGGGGNCHKNEVVMKFDLMEFSSRVTRSLGSVAIWQHWRSVFFDAVRSVGDNQTKVDEREGEVRVFFFLLGGGETTRN